MAERKLDVKRITYALFQGAGARKQGIVVAMTSPLPGEGVSYVAQLLAREVAGDALSRTLYCTVEALANAPLEAGGKDPFLPSAAGYWTLSADDAAAKSAWAFHLPVRQARLNAVRERFDYVILDCAAVAASSEVAGVAV
ncbi:MAG TPA: hypothetical protein VGD62_12350, partial [Acidobacteriaceae bacterium]